MSGLVDMVTGASAKKAQKMQAAAAESAQNQALAASAREQAQVDQAGAAATGQRGRRLLTYIGAAGNAKMG